MSSFDSLVQVVKLHTKLGKPIPATDPVPVQESKSNKASGTTVGKKTVSTPKITFVGGSTLKMGGNKASEAEKAAEKEAEEIEEEKDVIPVGQEYIEEMKNEAGKIVSFNCK